MNKEELKQSILQYALRGELTGEFHSKEKKYIEELDLEIPADWECKKLGEICDIKNGSTPKTNIKEFWDGEIPWITPADMNFKDKYILKGRKFITEKGLKSCSTYLLPKNSIIYSSRAPIGYVKIANNKICTNQGCKSFIVKNNKNLFYIFLFYSLIYITPFVIVLSSGTTFKEVSGKKLSEFIIPLPSVEEQEEIVKRVESLFEKIDKLEGLETDLETLKQELKESIIQHGIQGKLTEKFRKRKAESTAPDPLCVSKEGGPFAEQMVGGQRDTDNDNEYTNDILPDGSPAPFLIPASWSWQKLGDIAYNQGGFAFKSDLFCNKGIRVIRISDFDNNGIINKEKKYYKYSENLEQYKIKENDILMCMTGGTVGKACFIYCIEEDMYINQRIALLRNKENLYSKYLYYCLISQYIKTVINNNKTSTNDNISKTQMNEFIIPLPPLEEQKEIVSQTEKFFSIIDKLI